MPAAQLVVPDFDAIADSKIGTLSTIGSKVPPQAGTSGTTLVVGQVLSNTGVVKYSPYNVTTTGSAALNTFTIPKPHRLVRVETKTTTTAGADETTGITILIQRLVTTNTNNAAGNAMQTLQATSGASLKADNVFVFGEGYECEACTYGFSVNAPNTDTCIVVWYVQYL